MLFMKICLNTSKQLIFLKTRDNKALRVKARRANFSNQNQIK